MKPGPRALTIRQPWASAIAAGAKPVENRTWGTDYRGELYVVAGRAFVPHAGRLPLLRDAFGTGQRPVGWDDMPEGHRGAVVAVAQLVDVHQPPPFPNLCCMPWGEMQNAAGTVRHWVLEDVRPLAEPIPTVGGLGLRTATAELQSHVRDALKEAA